MFDLTSRGRSTSQTSSRCMRQKGPSVWIVFRWGPNSRSKRANPRSTKSYDVSRSSPRRHLPIAHKASKGLCGARLPRAFQTFCAWNRCRTSSGTLLLNPPYARRSALTIPHVRVADALLLLSAKCLEMTSLAGQGRRSPPGKLTMATYKEIQIWVQHQWLAAEDMLDRALQRAQGTSLAHGLEPNRGAAGAVSRRQAGHHFRSVSSLRDDRVAFSRRALRLD